MPFAIKEDYTNAVWCDVVSMDSRDILLEWKYVYDKIGTHGMQNNYIHICSQWKACYIMSKTTKEGIKGMCHKKQFKYIMSTEIMKIEIKFNVTLFCNPEQMM